MKFDIGVFFENLSRKFKFNLNMMGKTGTFHEDHCTFLIIICSFLLRMKNFSNKGCRKYRNTLHVK